MHPVRETVRTRAGAVIAILLASQALVACSTSRNPAAPAPAAANTAPAVAAAAPTTPAKTHQVSGGLVPSVAGAPILAGVDLGIFQRNGLDVSLQTFTSTPQIMTAIAAGQLDF